MNGRRIAFQVRAGNDVDVFAQFGMPEKAALENRDLLNQARVPQLFLDSGLATFGRDARRYPWTIGYRPSYPDEGIVLARHILKTTPRARVGVLYAGEAGAELLAGLRRGLGTRAGQLVEAVEAAGDVPAEVAELRGKRPHAFVVLAFGRIAREAQAEAARLGWRPRVYLASGQRAFADGAVSVAAFKDPADPRWRGDPGVALARRLLRGVTATDVAQMAAAFTLVEVLRRAGRNPTRAAGIAAARSLNEADNPFVIPGVVIRTSRTDGFPIQQVALQRWAGSHWTLLTGPLTIAP